MASDVTKCGSFIKIYIYIYIRHERDYMVIVREREREREGNKVIVYTLNLQFRKEIKAVDL